MDFIEEKNISNNSQKCMLGSGNLKKPKMIIFDYGGTILYEPGFSFLNGERAVFEHVVKNPRNVTPEQINDFNERIFGESGAAREVGFELHHNQMLRMKYEFNQIELDVSYEEAEQILWDNVSPMTAECRMPHVVEMLNFLKTQGIRSGVISNMGWSGNALKRRINTILPENQFEFIIASSEYGFRKPNPLIFELALVKAGLKPEEVWFCGDTFDADISGASGAGIFPIFYQGTSGTDDGPKRKPKLEQGGREQGVTQNASSLKNGTDFITISDWLELVDLMKGL